MASQPVARNAAAVLTAAVMAQISVSALQQGLPALGPVLQQDFALDTAGTAALLGVGSLGTAIAILLWAYYTYVKKNKLALADKELKGWQLFSNAKLYIDEVYNYLIVNPIEYLSKMAYSFIEIKVLNQGVFGFAYLFGKAGSIIRYWQTGLLSSYLFWMVIGLIGLISYYIIKLQFYCDGRQRLKSKHEHDKLCSGSEYYSYSFFQPSRK